MATPPPSVAELLGKVRQLTDEYKAGKPQSPHSFRELVSLLLSVTVMKKPEGAVRLIFAREQRKRFVVAGWGETDPIPLNDGRYLRLTITLELVDTDKGPRLKVYESSFQYQADRDGKQWIFRYDYLRNPPEPHPGAHLQLRARLIERRLLHRAKTVERVHFPTSRVSLEAIIRLLVEEFGVKCNEPSEVWRPVLTESERLFLQIAHQPL